MIAFKSLIVGRHESKVLFVWGPQEGVAILGAFRAIKDGIEAILNRDGISPALRVTLEEFRALAGKNVSRHSENRYCELSVKSLRDCFAFAFGVLQQQSASSGLWD